MPLIPAADLKDIIQQKWKNISQCLDTATRNTICTLSGLVSQPGQQLQRRHLVFTYGTLKRGEPNHYHFLNTENGAARLIGRARTAHTWPLIVTTKWNLPFLVWSQGHGKVVLGEVYEIDDKMLQFADEFEGHPEVYQRDRLLVTLYDEPPNNGNQQNQRPWWVPSGHYPQSNTEGHMTSVLNAFRHTDQSNEPTHAAAADGGAQGGRTIECWAYFLKHVRPAMFELPVYENYSSSNLDDMEYDTNEEITCIEDIMRALDEANL